MESSLVKFTGYCQAALNPNSVSANATSVTYKMEAVIVLALLAH